LRAQYPGISIHVVGHSYGGDTAAQIAAGMAKRGQSVDLLVTIDPVGRGVSQDFFQRVRDGSRRWINVNATGGGRLERSNLVAGLGSPYNYGPMGHADDFHNAPVPHGAFGLMMLSPLSEGRSIERLVAGR